MSRSRALALAGLTTLVVLAVDQLAKALVRGGIEIGGSRDVLGGTLRLVHVENDGVAFGRFAGNATVVGLIVAAAVLALLAYVGTHLTTPLIWLPTGLILGGALGNVVDRLRAGAVTDYVKLPGWPAFNLADVAITGGVILLLIVIERDARRADREREAGAEAADGAPDRA